MLGVFFANFVAEPQHFRLRRRIPHPGRPRPRMSHLVDWASHWAKQADEFWITLAVVTRCNF
jgi:hypothetical protein